MQTFSSPEPLGLICNDQDHVAKKRRALGTRMVCKWLQQLPSMLGIAVHHGKDTTHRTLQTMCNTCAWLQQCWKSCGKRIQHCCAMLRRSRNKRNVGSCWLKSLTGFKLCATTSNNMQQGVQTDATCNIQQCWELLANNVAFDCTGLQLNM